MCGLAAVCVSIVIGELTLPGQLDEVQLLAFLGPGDMSGDERIHESLEIRAPPLGKGISDLPLLIDALAGELRADGS